MPQASITTFWLIAPEHVASKCCKRVGGKHDSHLPKCSLSDSHISSRPHFRGRRTFYNVQMPQASVSTFLARIARGEMDRVFIAFSSHRELNPSTIWTRLVPTCEFVPEFKKIRLPPRYPTMGYTTGPVPEGMTLEPSLLAVEVNTTSTYDRTSSI